MNIDNLPFPDKVKDILKQEVKEFNPPQKAALKSGLLEGANMVVASPTASGKTLIAEMAFIKHFLRNGKTIYIVPLKALATEKYHEFKNKYEKIGMRVALSIGDLDSSDPWLGNYDLIIVSNEKMDSLLRHDIKWTKYVSLVIADEIHMLNDASRGPTLEVVLTRLRDMTNSQFIALSATIQNSEEIAKWLNAELVESDFRPIKLYRGVSYPDEDNYVVEFQEKKKLKFSADSALFEDTLRKKKQALVFVSTRRSAESAAEKLKIREYLTQGEKEKLNEISRNIENALASPTRQCRRLAGVVKNGVAFHHAGLLAAQRRLIEDNFRNGLIKFITATPTLCLDETCNIWNGLKEIKINKANKQNVLALKSKKLNEVPIYKINSMKSPKEMIKITTVCGDEIIVTKNHRVLIKKNGTQREVKAELCKPNGRIATAGRISLSKIQKPKWSDFVKDNKLPFNDTELNADAFYLIGAFLGDGYSGAEIEENKIKYKGSPCIVGEDKEVFDKIKDICKSMRIHYRISNNYYGTPQIVLTKSNWFREFLVRSGVEVGEKKYIHHLLLESEKRRISNLLKGLFDTDGYVEKRGVIGISNTSSKLIECIRKALLRFGIVTYQRKRKGSKMKIIKKEYKTKESYELSVFHSKCIERFEKSIGFFIKRKQKELENIITNFNKNLLNISCENCGYDINPNIFYPRSYYHRDWASKKIKIIEYLGEKGKKPSYEIKKDLGFIPWKTELRLNTHFGFINRKRVGNGVFWDLNEIGKWMYKQIKSGKNIDWFLNNDICPLCKNLLNKTKRCNWRKDDFDGDIFWDIIKSVEKNIPSSKRVYDVVLPDDDSNDHYFVSNGFIVHNSFGLNLPAWRVLIRDAKRYGGYYGANFIPVMEIHQMMGRAGRPKYDEEGEAIILGKSKNDAKDMKERYINAEPEPIYSKLSVESMLRMHTLALIATHAVNTKSQLKEFFSKTFFAHQYGNIDEVMERVEKILQELRDFKFIVFEKDSFISDEFTPAFEVDRDFKIRATKVGRRVSELYLDPLSANTLIKNFVPLKDIEYLLVMNECIEMWPMIRVKKTDDFLETEIIKHMVRNIPDAWDYEYDEFMERFKTSLMFNDWMNESGEDAILDTYGIAPGELYAKTKNAEWLLYSAGQLAMLLNKKDITNNFNRLRLRVKHGVKEELLKLIQVKGIGRVRARKLYKTGIKTPSDIKKISAENLGKVIGEKTAKKVLEGINEDLEKRMRKTKRR